MFFLPGSFSQVEVMYNAIKTVIKFQLLRNPDVVVAFVVAQLVYSPGLKQGGGGRRGGIGG